MITARPLSHHKLSKPIKLSLSSSGNCRSVSSGSSWAKSSFVRRNGACRSKQSTSVAERPPENEASASESRQQFEAEQPNHAKPSTRRWKKTAYLRARKQQFLEIPEREKPLGEHCRKAFFCILYPLTNVANNPKKRQYSLSESCTTICACR